MSAIALAPTNDFAGRHSTYLGGTDVAGIMGIHPYCTPHSVYREKVHGESPEPNGPMYWGSVMEPVIAEEYIRKYGGRLAKSATYVLVGAEFLGATPDYEFLAFGPEDQVLVELGLNPADVLLECKTASFFVGRNFGEHGSDQVPDQYVCQCTWQMHITGRKACVLCVLIGGNDFRRYLIQYDADLARTLETEATRFWTEHVVRKCPPPLTGFEIDTSWVKTHFTVDNGGKVFPDEECHYWCVSLEAARKARVAAELAEDALENQIKAFMGEASVLETEIAEEVVQFTWKANKNGVRSFRTPFKGRAA